MKKIIPFLSFGLLMVSQNVKAQDQLKHVKCTYEAPNGNLYINKDLPVYLRLATSPDDTAHSILLKSKVSAQYTNPFYFDTEGWNSVRTPSAVNKQTRKMVMPERDIIFEVYADGLAPRSTSRFYGAPVYYKGSTIYYGKGLMVSLNSTDAVSGVEKTYTSINRAAYENYNTPVAMNVEQTYTFQYYASDNVGNAEKPNSKSYIVDLTPPVSTLSLSAPKLGDIISPKASFSLGYTDNLSGVMYTKSNFDRLPANTYNGAIHLWNLGDGDHTFTYYSTDNVQNAETKVVYSFYLDRIPPVPVAEIVGDQFFDNYKYISSRTHIDLSATDNKAGVESITYVIDNGRAITYTDHFPMPTTDGVHFVTYWSVDKVTNVSEKRHVMGLYMDNTLPTTSISYGSPQFFDRDTLFITGRTNITLHPIDHGAGVMATAYDVDGGTDVGYHGPFKIADEGFRKINFFSTDKVNNVESKKSSQVYIDNTPPEIYVNYSIQPVADRDGLKVYPNYTRLYVAATDRSVGTNRIQYSINGGPLQDYSSPYTLDISEVPHFAKGGKKYTVKVVATDKLGNKNERIVEFYIANK